MTIFVKEVSKRHEIACKLDILASQVDKSCNVFFCCCMSINRDQEWIKGLFTRLPRIDIVKCHCVSDMQAAKEHQACIFQKELMVSSVKTCSASDRSFDVFMQLRMSFLFSKTYATQRVNF